MSSIIGKIKSFDLNLLAVFAAIDQHRHITKAAKVLGITQPALSHALGRLRLQLDDQLFVKSSHGMVPTPRAVKLAGPIRMMLESFDREVLGSETFEPVKMRRTFRIAVTDFVESLIFPRLLGTLEKEAPATQILSQTTPFVFPREALEQGKTDIAISGFYGELPDGFYQQKLFSDEFVCAVRKDHPRLGKRQSISTDDFCEERHFLVAPGGELRAKVDDVLQRKKKTRFIAAGINNFLSAAWILPESDAILTGPSRYINQLAKAASLHVLPSPIEMPGITVVQVWHERNNQDPGHRWIREHIKAILQT